MPRGPKGEKRPADVIGAAVLVGRIATGDADESAAEKPKNPAAVALGQLGGQRGGEARAAKLSAADRKAIAQKAAKSRWNRDKPLDI
jgi:hypothetical protein